MTEGLGVSAIVNITLTLVCIGVSWWALQSVRFDLFLANTKGAKAKTLMIVLSIVLGHGLARFLVDYMGWSRMLTDLF
ncbi:DUF1146 family protein [Numidum massiliense]|uniref:DUF1146 family protein n=1 Tax=Numidum massiliense TaxID=1522315 RepID=UPI0006D52EDD|nr:DUF1146 family protein [Numidum massiliense]